MGGTSGAAVTDSRGRTAVGIVASCSTTTTINAGVGGVATRIKLRAQRATDAERELGVDILTR